MRRCDAANFGDENSGQQMAVKSSFQVRTASLAETPTLRLSKRSMMRPQAEGIYTNMPHICIYAYIYIHIYREQTGCGDAHLGGELADEGVHAVLHRQHLRRRRRARLQRGATCLPVLLADMSQLRR